MLKLFAPYFGIYMLSRGLVPLLSRLKDCQANPSQQYLDKRLFVQLNGSRKVIGVLRGYDVRVKSTMEKSATIEANAWDRCF